MSDQDQGDDKSFLSRWSQRKQEAKQPDRDAPAADADAPPRPLPKARPSRSSIFPACRSWRT